MKNMEANYCTDCKKETETVLDCRAGDTICTECGLVLESSYIDPTSEWRTFPDTSNGQHFNRFGQPTDPFLNNSILSTHILSEPGTTDSSSVSSLHNRVVLEQDSSERVLVKGFEMISEIADKLGLDALIVNRAKDILKQYKDVESCNARNPTTSICGACLFIACREFKLTRTFPELLSAMDGVSRKEFHKAKESIKEKVKVEVRTLNLDELVKRFCSNLGMSREAVKAVDEAVEKSKNIDIRKNPNSILAAIIYMVSLFSDETKHPKDISAVTSVAEATIKRTFKDLCPFASSLIPDWYAKEEDVTEVCKV